MHGGDEDGHDRPLLNAKVGEEVFETFLEPVQTFGDLREQGGVCVGDRR